MLVLALDSSTPTLSLALFDTDSRRLIKERAFEPGRAHSVLLPASVQQLVEDCGLTLNDVGGIAVGLGPGSFTGLRVGLATAKGIGYARQIPLAGVSSLRAMARTTSELLPQGILLVPCLHARRNEVYAGFYRSGSLESVSEETAGSPAALAKHLGEHSGSPVLFGNGREANLTAFAAFRPPPADAPTTPAAGSVARLVEAWGSYDAVANFALEPHYIRASEAEVKFPNGLTSPGVASSRIQDSRKVRRRS